ncbi:metallophosphoesterase [Bacillus velezensis]|uniref:metallophosphoesterase n=1 Tax=Bacillus TaxID=1386 RepID=UPI0020A7646F|nr:metallophosphoesterase [Bacillus velezensis]MED3334311.1 metallophosphoesterase [Bacillus velezensis]MED3676427.1 metallophosphoesterase [Bacillus velezensis]USY31313.1 metallophosphoesterase [Bacillus velezensis]WRT02967.1 metallophosphoesterase [Bacillus velezensis]WRT11512.1 metallophosphoesterase [Bacillus velezensis]
MKLTAGILGSLAGAAAVMAAVMYKTANGSHLKTHTFTLDKMKGMKPLTIFFISDVHRRLINEKLLREAAGYKPDAVLLGGDLAEGGVPYARIEENIKRLTALAPVMYVWGNNDYEVSQQKLLSLLRAYKVIPLRNESVQFTYKGETVTICGVDDIRMMMDDYDSAIRYTDADKVNLLLCHNPDIHEQMRESDGIDAVFSGHTHGGQIRFGRFGPYELGGTGTVKKAHYLISNGYGTTKVPLRLGAKPETHMITLCGPDEPSS